MTSSKARAGKTLTYFLLFLTLLASGSVPVFLRYLLKPGAYGGLGLDPWVVNALRYSFAPVFWLPFVAMKWRQGTADDDGSSTLGKSHHRRGIWKAAVIPTLFNLLTQICWGVAAIYAE